MEPIICLPDDPTRLLLRSCLYDERFNYPAAFLFFEHLNAIHLCTHSSSWHRLLCLPGSGGPTVACNTPSAPGGARHRSSDGGHRGDSVGRDSRQNKTCKIMNAHGELRHTCPTSPKARSRLLASVYFLTLLWSQPSSASLLLVSLRDLHSTTW